MDGFERFAQGHLITLFSATNYCGTANNAGALGAGGRAGSRGCAPIALFLPNAPRHPSPPSHFTPSPSRCHPSVGPGPGDGAQAHPPATTAAGVAAGVRLGRRRRGRAPQPRPGHMDAGGQRRAPPHAAPGAGWKRVAVAGILRVKGGGRASRGVWGILSNFGGAAAGMETFGTAVLGRGGALVTNLFSDVNSCSAARWGALSTSPRAPRGQSNRWPTPTARASPRACPACRLACRRVPGAGAACVGSTGGGQVATPAGGRGLWWRPGRHPPDPARPICGIQCPQKPATSPAATPPRGWGSGGATVHAAGANRRRTGPGPGPRLGWDHTG